MNILRFIVWFAAFVLRFAFMIVGVFVVPFTLVGSGKDKTCAWFNWFGDSATVPEWYGTTRWRKYVWMALRNPLEGLDGTLEQPIPEKMPNPDETVRFLKKPSDSRWMEHGIFWEYWYLKSLSRGRYLEFRIGWKFVDGNEDFVPTIQFGPKK